MQLYKFGSLVIEFAGKEELILPYLKEFKPINGNSSIDIKINFHEKKPCFNEDTIGYLGKNIGSYSTNSIYINTSPFFSYEVTDLFTDEITTVNLYIKDLNFIRKLYVWLRGLISVEHTSLEDYIKGCFASYSGLYWILSVCLHKKKQAFIHSGVVKFSNEALMLAGTGGCGKTSTILSFLEISNVNYLSEDFGILSKDNSVVYCEKTISLYHSDVIKGSPIAASSLKKQKAWIKFKWYYLTRLFKLNPIIKISPLDFSVKEHDEVSLKHSVYLTRVNTNDLCIKSITQDEFSERTMKASIRELKTFIDILYLIEANATKDTKLTFPSVDNFLKEYQKIIRENISDTPCHLLAIPEKIHPDDICKYITEKLDLNV